jgi:hypothetical protein
MRKIDAGISILLLASVCSAAPVTLTGFLTGPNEFPVNSSPGTGFTTVTYDPVTHILTVDVTFSGLTGTTTASHIHCCVSRFAAMPVAGVATQTPTFAGFPLGVTAGTYSNSFNLTQASSYNPAFITANGGSVAVAEAVLGGGILAGNSYLNIHSSTFGGGEIRAFLDPVPEPGTAVLALTGLAAAVVFGRRRRRAS